MADLAETNVARFPLHEVRHNLPVHLSSFVGRERELSEVTDALATTRALTLTGASGCGKSRLAARAALRVLDRFQHGAWWVELAPLTEPRMVELALIQALGVRPGARQSGLDAAVSYLSSRDALVILDNCEHLLDACARVAETLALECPGVTVLATSREPLRIDGELDWRVPSLSLPPDGDDAVELFVARAANIRPGFRLGDDNTPDVIRLCRGLDGIPLAIELAAARLRMLSVPQIAAGLTDRFAVLTGGTRTAVARQRTLRASVDWSHDLLGDTERRVLRRLGVFLGGFTLEAAEAVCAGDDLSPAGVFDALSALVDKSLVQADDRGTAVRYRLLETIRSYALERLAEAGETALLRDRHRDHYLRLAERLEPELLDRRQLAALALLDPESANLTQAIERAAATEPGKALRLCVALTFWWQLRGLFRQGDAAFHVALDAADTAPSVERARALYGRASLLTLAGMFDDAVVAGTQALQLAQVTGDRRTVGRCLLGAGLLTMRSDPAGSRPWYEQALEIARADGDEYLAAMATTRLANAFLHQSDVRGARPYVDRALALSAALGNHETLAWAKGASAWSTLLRGDYATARTAAAIGIAEAHLVGQIPSETSPTCMHALVDMETGEPERAVEMLSAICDRAIALGAEYVLAVAESTLVWALTAAGRLSQARRLAERLIERDADGHLHALVITYVGLAEVLLLSDGPDQVIPVAQEGLRQADRKGDAFLAAGLRLVLGRAATRRGEHTLARTLHHEALTALIDNEHRCRLAHALESLAESTAGVADHVGAARILGAVQRLRTEEGSVPWKPRAEELNALQRRLRQELGGDAFERSHGEGLALTAEEIIAYVRRTRGARGRPPAGWDSLTPTERQVVDLVGQGLTNPQIAARLFVSRETVKGHVSAALRKLGVANRTELAAEVTRHA